MFQLCFLLLLILTFVQYPCAQVRPKLLGLERIYFHQVHDLRSDSRVGSVFPMQMKDYPSDSVQNASLEEMTVRDFFLDGQRIIIRQVVDCMHPRISETWWALYAEGERTCLWRFRAYASDNEGKALSNYLIDRVFRSSAKSVLIRVRGEMVRPAGVWWTTGKVFGFAETDSGFALSFVENSFDFFQGSDAGITVKVEDRVAGQFRQREVKNVRKAVLRRCGFSFPEDEPVDLTWDALHKTARCATKKGATESIRALHEASFVERGK